MTWLRSVPPSNLCRVTLAIAVAVMASGPVLASSGASDAQTSGGLSPGDLVRLAVAHEVAAADTSSVKHMFRSRKSGPRGSQTRLYVETTQAMAGMTIAYDDRPISEQQSQMEFSRLDHLTSDRRDLQRKQKQEHDDAEHTLRIVKALPDAFVFQFDGTEQSTPGMGKAGDELVRLKFQPNPRYTPPSRVEQVLMGMQGTVVIDQTSKRLARINASLFRDVTFGWGILGHLDKGGNFLVEQADVGEGAWEITHMQLNFTGKIMMFKGFSINSDEHLSDFRRVPGDITFQRGVELLKQEWAKLQSGESRTASAGTNSH